MSTQFQWFENLDITASNPDFRFTETIKLGDKTLPFIVPNHTPFFAESLIVKDSHGLIVKSGFKVGGELTVGIEYTGKQVVEFIVLDDDFLNKNTHITITYQAITKHKLGRNELYTLYQKAKEHKGLPIDWRSQVDDKPEFYPYFKHFHHNKTEIRGWEEFIYFCRLLVGIYQRQNPDIPNIDEAVAKLKEQQESVKDDIYTHDAIKDNIHGVTEEELGIENIFNYPLATVKEDIAGIRQDAYSTPLGAVLATINSNVVVDNLMQSDGFPMSLYGHNSYIPPSVSSNLSVLGSSYNSSAFCLESNGELILLTNRCNGKDNGLYYAKSLNFKADTPTISLTTTKYTTEKLIQDKVIVDYVLGGSGENVLMVGNIKRNVWYCALTNGTLDMSSHKLVKVDVTGMENFNPVNSTIHLMKNYVYILSAKDTTTKGNETTALYLYRFKQELLLGDGTIVPESVRINFETPFGTKFTDADSLVIDVHNRSGKGGFDRYLFSYTSDVERVKHIGKWQVITKSLITSGNLIACAMFVTLVIKSVNKSLKPIIKTVELLYTFDVDSNTFKLAQDNYFGKQVVDPTNPGSFPRASDIEYFNYKSFTGYETPLSYPSAMILNNGIIVNSYCKIMGGIGLTVINTFNTKLTPYQLLSKPLTKEIFNPSLIRNTVANFESPNGVGLLPSPVFYTDEGEFFKDVGINNGDMVVRTHFRKVTGDYETRLGVSNLNGEVMLRPLTDKVKPVFGKLPGIIGLTGNKTKLTELGFNYGKVSFAVGEIYKNNGLWYNDDGMLDSSNIKLITNYTKTDTDLGVEVTPTTETIYPFDAFKDMLRSSAVASSSNLQWESRNIALTVFNFKEFNIPNLDHVLIATVNPLDTTKAVTTFIFFEAKFKDGVFYYGVPKAIYNYERELDGLTDNDISFVKRSHGLGYVGYGQLYVDDTNTTLLLSSSNTYLDSLLVNDVKAFTLAGSDVNELPLEYGNCYQVIYNHGLTKTNLTLLESNGYSLGYYQSMEEPSKNFITVSPYLESSWNIFFSSTEPLMINGNIYELTPGVVYIPDITSDYKNKTYYVYATVINGVPQYLFTLTPFTHVSGNMVAIGTFATDEYGISSINIDRSVVFAKKKVVRT